MSEQNRNQSTLIERLDRLATHLESLHSDSGEAKLLRETIAALCSTPDRDKEWYREGLLKVCDKIVELHGRLAEATPREDRDAIGSAQEQIEPISSEISVANQQSILTEQVADADRYLDRTPAIEQPDVELGPIRHEPCMAPIYIPMIGIVLGSPHEQPDPDVAEASARLADGDFLGVEESERIISEALQPDSDHIGGADKMVCGEIRVKGESANLVSAAGDAGNNQETGSRQAQHSGGNPGSPANEQPVESPEIRELEIFIEKLYLSLRAGKIRDLDTNWRMTEQVMPTGFECNRQKDVAEISGSYRKIHLSDILAAARKLIDLYWKRDNEREAIGECPLCRVKPIMVLRHDASCPHATQVSTSGIAMTLEQEKPRRGRDE